MNAAVRSKFPSAAIIRCPGDAGLQTHSSDSDELDGSAIICSVATARLNIKKNSGVPRQLLQELKHNLVMRHVSSGIELLNRHRHLFAFVGPEQANAAAFADEHLLEELRQGRGANRNA